MTKRISQLTAAATLTGTELVEVSQLSASVTITATTISADSTDNSFNDSANGFVTAGFTTGKSVNVIGFTGNVANNIVSGVVTSVAAGKIIIGGTDGDVIVTDAAGESVTIKQWDSKRSTVQGVANKAPGAGREMLASNRTYYVRTDGSNSNDGLANTSGGAFLTIQKCIDVVCSTLDIAAGFTVTCQVADGTYTGANVMKQLIGAGSFVIKGNSGTPANVVVSVTSNHCFYNNIGGTLLTVKDMKLTTTTSGSCIFALYGGLINLTNIDFGACASQHKYALGGGNVTATGNYSISGGAASHENASRGGTVDTASKTVTITGTPAFSTGYAVSSASGAITNYGCTFSGSATGVRYALSLNGTINTLSGGATYFPGNSAGTNADGSGVYA